MIKNTYINFSFIRFIIVLTLFVPIVYNEYENHNTQILYSAVIYVPIYFICLGIFSTLFIFDLKLFLKNRNIKSLVPTFVGLFLISISIIIYSYHNYKIHQKTILKASSNTVNINEYDDIKYIIEFKVNNDYLISEILQQGLVTNYYYGEFIKKDSIYYLDNIIGKNKISNRFLIRRNNKFNDKHLVQLNKHNTEITNEFNFKIK